MRSLSGFTPSGRDVSRFRPYQVLVQAHRNPDTPWRVRPVFDEHGVIPANAWHAVVPKQDAKLNAEALFAVFTSALANAWVHASVATKNIPITALESLPLPSPWGDHAGRLARLGARLLWEGATQSLIDTIERTVADAYGLDERIGETVQRLLSASQAPEGRQRFNVTVPAVDSPEDFGMVRTGAVLGSGQSNLRVWVSGGHDEGEVHRLPGRMPGWLAIEGAVFDMIGADVETAHYRFHRASHLTDPELFGTDRGGAEA